MADKDFVAEVEVALDNSGHVIGNEWKKGSGDKQWDASVRKAVAQTQSISRPPPKGFPGKFLVRFDVQVDTEPLLSASLR
jgi:TonB family protein